MEPWDGEMQLGTMVQAMDFLTSVGPVGRIMESAEPDQVREIQQRVQAVLAQNLTDEQVVMDCGAWLVSARP